MTKITDKTLEGLIEAIGKLNQDEKLGFLNRVRGNVTPDLFGALKLICVMTDPKVQDAMFEKLWAKAHPN